MTKKKAIEVVVANVGIEWMRKDWTQAYIQFNDDGDCELRFFISSYHSVPYKAFKAWYIPREWLEKEGYLKCKKRERSAS